MSYTISVTSCTVLIMVKPKKKLTPDLSLPRKWTVVPPQQTNTALSNHRVGLSFLLSQSHVLFSMHQEIISLRNLFSIEDEITNYILTNRFIWLFVGLHNLMKTHKMQ